jgi:hypothetical protein
MDLLALHREVAFATGRKCKWLQRQVRLELTHAAVFNHLEETLEISVRNGQFCLAVGQGPQEVLKDVRAQKLAVDGRA